MADFLFEELKEFDKKIKESKMPLDLKDRVQKMLDRLNRMAKLGGYSSEFETTSRYINVVTSIPWGQTTIDNLDLKNAKEVLDSNHYGLEEVKSRVLEFLAVKTLRNKTNAKIQSDSKKALLSEEYNDPILCLVGLQGIGKTTMAASIAKALGREFIRISLGAAGSILELRGQSKASPDAEPGQIIKALIRTKTANPLILLDEIDKASGEKGLRADIMAALLEILDPEQNNTFRDHYIDFPVDLSKVLFVCSANNTGTLSTALMDRLEVIRMPAYTDEQKKIIAKDYLFEKVVANTGLNIDQIEIEENVWDALIRPLGFDTGIRSLRRNIETIARKVAKDVVEGNNQKAVISVDNLQKYLPDFVNR